MKSTPSGPVTAEAVIDDHGRGRLTVLRLAWSRSDPLAVELLLTARPDHPALPRGRWVILRDFLRHGLDEPTGDGAVRLRPDDLRDRVWFELARRGRAACVSVPRPLVRDFLDRTEQSVPCGAERSQAMVDALLARLLGSELPDPQQLRREPGDQDYPPIVPPF